MRIAIPRRGFRDFFPVKYPAVAVTAIVKAI